MRKNYMRSSFISLLIPVFFLLVLITVSALASMTEVPTNRSGIYIVFSVISIFMMIILPAVNVICAVVGIVFQLKALHNHEPKGKILLNFAASSIYILLSAQYSYLFYLGIMSA